MQVWTQNQDYRILWSLCVFLILQHTLKKPYNCTEIGNCRFSRKRLIERADGKSVIRILRFFNCILDVFGHLDKQTCICMRYTLNELLLFVFVLNFWKIIDYLQMDLACSGAFAQNFDRMDCSVLENNWALTFSFYPSSSTSTLSCSRRRNPPPA